MAVIGKSDRARRDRFGEYTLYGWETGALRRGEHVSGERCWFPVHHFDLEKQLPFQMIRSESQTARVLRKVVDNSKRVSQLAGGRRSPSTFG